MLLFINMEVCTSFNDSKETTLCAKNVKSELGLLETLKVTKK